MKEVLRDTVFKYFAQPPLTRDDVPELPNPEGLTELDVPDIYATIAGVAGGIALAIVVYGGIKYILSRGNPQETAKAQKTVLYGIAGLLVAVFAVVIISFVVERIWG